MPASVLIVDDHAGFRARARMMLGSAGYHVVAEAADGADGVYQARRLRPGVVLLDVQLPDTTGFEVARVLAAGPSPPVVVLVSAREAADHGSLVPEFASSVPPCLERDGQWVADALGD